MISTKFITAKILVACLIVFASSASIDISKNIKPCMCTKEFDPVCASNGITYSNKCMFECNNEKKDLHIVHPGACGMFNLELFGSTCTRKCNHLKRLVCGTDGVTYENPCMFKCAQLVDPKLKIKHMGAC